MYRSVYYKVADHILKVNVKAEVELRDYLPSFRDFEVLENDVDSVLLEVNILAERAPISDNSVNVLSDSSEIWGEGFLFGEVDGNYITVMESLEKDSKVVMISSSLFDCSTIYLGEADEQCFNILSWFLMVVFGQGVLPYDTVLIHASVVERDEKEAYAFLGKSGTGKSTHSRLWLEFAEGFSLLNDDNPVVRFFDSNTVYIYGTPWSGKTDCYRDLKVRLMGLVRLRQSKFNHFSFLKDADSLIAFLPSCTAIRWNKILFNHMLNTIEKVLSVIPIGVMDCRIDQEAVNISYQGIKN